MAPRHDYRESRLTFRIPDTRGDSEVFLLVEFVLPTTEEAAANEWPMELTASVAMGAKGTDAPVAGGATTEPAQNGTSARVADTGRCPATPARRQPFRSAWLGQAGQLPPDAG